jgi:hypothetical protein
LSRIVLFVFLMVSASSYAQVSCYSLDGASVYSNETQTRFLGFFGSAYASDSIMNRYGSYGSQYSSTSVRNQYGTYGSSYSSLSANSSYTSTPPLILKNGQLIGYLTVSNLISGGVSLAQIDASCSFYSSSPSPNTVSVPTQLTGLQALPGETTIGLYWNSTLGATRYDIYVSLSQSGEKTFLQSTASTSFVATGASPGVNYYFFVYPANSVGAGSGMWVASSVVVPTPAPEPLWPGNFNGVYPENRPNLGLNNIGFASNTGSTVYSCVAILSGGQPASVGGLHKLDITLEIVFAEQGVLRILRSREFNQGNYLASDGKAPTCSGAFEATTGIFEDIWKVGEKYYAVRLLLHDEAKLELRLLAAVEL